ncbi:MAG: hypothetical protein JSR73_16615 [Proteobacteria bacterium]|nr:hypothetical protein [Pseudomonadota bacterium]
MTQATDAAADEARRSRTRRLTLLLFGVAAAVYAAFIVVQYLRARG